MHHGAIIPNNMISVRITQKNQEREQKRVPPDALPASVGGFRPKLTPAAPRFSIVGILCPISGRTTGFAINSGQPQVQYLFPERRQTSEVELPLLERVDVGEGVFDEVGGEPHDGWFMGELDSFAGVGRSEQKGCRRASRQRYRIEFEIRRLVCRSSPSVWKPVSLL